jgi:hypothetical protein
MRVDLSRESGCHKSFYESVKGDFYTAHEAKGSCLINHPLLESTSVIADFLLYPRPHLIEAGFFDAWFAVEIKRPSTPPVYAFRQAFWYTLATFQIKDRLVTPAFAAVWVPDSERLDDYRRDAEARVFGHMNVAVMTLNVSGYVLWDLSFGLNRYACRHERNDSRGWDEKLVISQARKGFKLKVGSSGKDPISSVVMADDSEGEP